ncbi:MAG: glycosyltransferase family 4 protein [Bacteroidales bacterium]|nr:glycosyltransferase family 4 protein [Bacteroidales bacterium]
MGKTNKILRTTTVPGSLNNFCRGLLRELTVEGYEVVAVSSPGPAMEEIAEREGVRTIAVPMYREISPLNDLKSLLGLIKVFRKEKPTMVHSMTPKAGLLSMMAAWVCRVPVRLHTFTGLVFPTSTGLKQKILIFTDRLTCACATHIVPEGEGVKNDLINYGITKKPLKVLGYGNVRGIDLKRFDPELPEVKAEAEKIRKDGVFTFVSIGRLVGDKGINELVEAFKRLNERYPDTRLILIGSEERELDPLRDETIAEIENNSAIEAVGRQSDVRPWLLASDTLVHPSYREGFPNVVIEAGAMGLPSIVTDINGSREIIIEGENGTIVPSKDIAALETAMEKFIKERELTKAMASKARNMAANRFEQGFVHKCLRDYYKEIMRVN